jgi:hypothetical protein
VPLHAAGFKLLWLCPNLGERRSYLRRGAARLMPRYSTAHQAERRGANPRDSPTQAATADATEVSLKKKQIPQKEKSPEKEFHSAH